MQFIILVLIPLQTACFLQFFSPSFPSSALPPVMFSRAGEGALIFLHLGRSNSLPPPFPVAPIPQSLHFPLFPPYPLLPFVRSQNQGAEAGPGADGVGGFGICPASRWREAGRGRRGRRAGGAEAADSGCAGRGDFPPAKAAVAAAAAAAAAAWTVAGKGQRARPMAAVAVAGPRDAGSRWAGLAWPARRPGRRLRSCGPRCFLPSSQRPMLTTAAAPPLRADTRSGPLRPPAAAVSAQVRGGCRPDGGPGSRGRAEGGGGGGAGRARRRGVEWGGGGVG